LQQEKRDFRIELGSILNTRTSGDLFIAKEQVEVSGWKISKRKLK
jgi:hypothetical protein